jgi:hypothetical protein
VNRSVGWVAGLLGVQTFHMAEHGLQTYQKYRLGMDQAHGLLGHYFDSDWIHLAFNLGLGVAFALVAWLAVRTGAADGTAWNLYLAGMVAQGYHIVEHAVKWTQSAFLGHDPALGILGNWYQLIPLHLVLNGIVYLLATPYLLRFVLQGWRDASLPAGTLKTRTA